MSLEKYSDARLKQLAVEKDIFCGGLRRVGEGRQVVGPEVIEADVLTILGSERGLWDESGYAKESTEREFDLEFSRRCDFVACDLWYQDVYGEYPLLIKLVLLLKHGVRMVDDDSLVHIYRLLTVDRWFYEEKGDAIFDCRLETLRRAVTTVLADRGYEVKLGHA